MDWKRRSGRTIIFLLCVVFSLCGCGSLAKKFVRERKNQEKPEQSMVLSPEVYPDSRLNTQDSYRYYLALWSGWQDVLIDSLSDRAAGQRRGLESAQEAIDNLAAMQQLLSEEKQAVVKKYLDSLNALKAAIAKDIYGINKQSARKKAETLKREIEGALQYEQVKDSFK
ncbi:MAG: hypothetical protein WCY10_04985 [Candidatus Omnitrophota bacterium]